MVCYAVMALATEHAAKLLDFSNGLDVNLLDSVIDNLYNGSGQSVSTICTNNLASVSNIFLSLPISSYYPLLLTLSSVFLLTSFILLFPSWLLACFTFIKIAVSLSLYSIFSLYTVLDYFTLEFFFDG